jgi:hypothetical protein
MLFEKRGSTSWKAFAVLIAVTFCMSILMIDMLRVRTSQAEVGGLPAPTKLLPLSSSWSAPLLRGLRLDPENPLKIEFIIDSADQGTVTVDEAGMLIRYFLAALTLPEEELWVNLSPYEEERTVPERLATTDMGRDLLSQDYVLKQLLSSLTYPESATGKAFWEKTYQQLLDVAGTTSIPVNTFNKVWILPDKALVYENMGLALIKDATLKVMGEEDYLAMENNVAGIRAQKTDMGDDLIDQVSEVSSRVMKEVVLPKVIDDVNYGRNFANLRQIYHSLILAKWFKEKFKRSFYAHYMNKGKVHGIDMAAPDAKDKIYKLYVEAFEKGVFDYIKKEYDPGERMHLKRRYFSGGMAMGKELEVESSAVSSEELPGTFSSSSMEPVVVKAELDPRNAMAEPSISEAAINAVAGALAQPGIGYFLTDSERDELSRFELRSKHLDNAIQINAMVGRWLQKRNAAVDTKKIGLAILDALFAYYEKELASGKSMNSDVYAASAWMVNRAKDLTAANPQEQSLPANISPKTSISSKLNVVFRKIFPGLYGSSSISKLAIPFLVATLLSTNAMARNPWRVIGTETISEKNGIRTEIIHTPRTGKGQYYIERKYNSRGQRTFQKIVIDRDMQKLLGLEFSEFAGEYGERILSRIMRLGETPDSGVEPNSMNEDKDNVGGIDLQSLEVEAIEGSSPLLYHAPFDPQTFDGFDMRVTSLERFNSPEAMLATFM